MVRTLSKTYRQDRREKNLALSCLDECIDNFKRSNQRLINAAEKTAKNLRANGHALDKVRDHLDSAETL